MNARSYTSEGIILGRKNYGEADRILVIYSKLHGRVSLIAKGVRRPKSKKRGHLEIFSRINFQAVTGHGLDLMTEAEVIDAFPEIRKSLNKVSLAYYFCEVIGKITHENESNHELYELIIKNLEELKLANQLKSLRLNFILKLLTILGYWPEGKSIGDPDEELEKVIERQIYSKRVGKAIAS